MGKFDEVGAVKALKVKNISVNLVSKTIKIPVSANVGNATNAKIDFLCNYCGYTKEYTNDGKAIKVEKEANDYKIKHKDIKINMNLKVKL